MLARAGNRGKRYGDPNRHTTMFPHCDSRVLHAPGKCDVCDESASDLQDVRVAWGIAFTGETPGPRGLPCPADHDRGPTHMAWPGNRPVRNGERTPPPRPEMSPSELAAFVREVEGE